MSSHSLGIFLALMTWIFWSMTPFFFAATGRSIGPFATNLTRLLLASVILFVLCGLQLILFPAIPHPTAGAWMLFIGSGTVGLAVGDYFLYSSLTHVGPQRTSLLMTLSPALTAAMSWGLMRETLSPAQLAGMALVLGGVAGATWPKKEPPENSEKKIHHGMWHGAWRGLLSAFFTSISTVFARQAFLRSHDLSPLFATTIRIGSGALALLIFALVTGKLLATVQKATPPAMAKRIFAGTLTGPIIGTLCYVAALKYQSAGVVTTITFMTPLLVIPVATWRYKARLSGRVLLGGASALFGVALLGWNP